MDGEVTSRSQGHQGRRGDTVNSLHPKNGKRLSCDRVFSDEDIRSPAEPVGRRKSAIRNSLAAKAALMT